MTVLDENNFDSFRAGTKRWSESAKLQNIRAPNLEGWLGDPQNEQLREGTPLG